MSEDTFIECKSKVGGAIFAEDFDVLDVRKSVFKNNSAESGKGASIFANRYHKHLKLKDNFFEQELNSVMSAMGKDMFVEGNFWNSTWFEYDLKLNETNTNFTTDHFYEFAGGFHISNMHKISTFSNNQFIFQKANSGGCIHVELD